MSNHVESLFMSGRKTMSNQVETLFLGFSKDSSGELFLLVGNGNAGEIKPSNLIHGDKVKKIYKELTGNELKIQEDKK